MDPASPPDPNEPRVSYRQLTSGKWTRTTYASQCSHKVLFRPCQGRAGHKGVHWVYSECGDLWVCDNAAEPVMGGGALTCPPGNDSWISPVELHKYRHSNYSVTEEVADLELIGRLEAGRLRPGESRMRAFDLERVKAERRLEWTPEKLAELEAALAKKVTPPPERLPFDDPPPERGARG